MGDDPYQTLGVGRDASKSEIKSAYYRQAQQHHPDHHAQADAAAESRFRQAKDAYDALSSNSRRAPDFHSGPRSSYSSASSGAGHGRGGGAHSSSSASGGSALVLHGQGGGGAHSSSSGSGGYSSSGSGGYSSSSSDSSSGSSGYGHRRRGGARSYSSTSGSYGDQYEEDIIYAFAASRILNYAKTVDPEKVRQHEERVRQEKIRAREEKEARKLARKIAKAEFTERMKTLATKKKTEFVEWVKNRTSYMNDGRTMNWWDS